MRALKHFWIIWNPSNTYAPTTQFKDETIARIIAIKLAMQYPTDKFYVMEVRYVSLTETVNGKIITSPFKKEEDK